MSRIALLRVHKCWDVKFEVSTKPAHLVVVPGFSCNNARGLKLQSRNIWEFRGVVAICCYENGGFDQFSSCIAACNNAAISPRNGLRRSGTPITSLLSPLSLVLLLLVLSQTE